MLSIIKPLYRLTAIRAFEARRTSRQGPTRYGALLLSGQCDNYNGSWYIRYNNMSRMNSSTHCKQKQCETMLLMSLVIHYWMGDVQDSQGLLVSEMSYIVSGGALNTIQLNSASNHWRRLGASFRGNGVCASAPKFFLPPPPKKSEIWGNGRGLTVSWNLLLAQYYRVLMLYILPYILPF